MRLSQLTSTLRAVLTSCSLAKRVGLRKRDHVARLSPCKVSGVLRAVQVAEDVGTRTAALDASNRTRACERCTSGARANARAAVRLGLQMAETATRFSAKLTTSRRPGTARRAVLARAACCFAERIRLVHERNVTALPPCEIPLILSAVEVAVDISAVACARSACNRADPLKIPHVGQDLIHVASVRNGEHRAIGPWDC